MATRGFQMNQLVRQFQSRDITPPKVGLPLPCPPAEGDQTKYVVLVWGKSPAKYEVNQGHYKIHVKRYMTKRQKEQKTDQECSDCGGEGSTG